MDKEMKDLLKDMLFVIVSCIIVVCALALALVRQADDIKELKVYTARQTAQMIVLQNEIKTLEERVKDSEKKSDTIVDCVLNGRW